MLDRWRWKFAVTCKCSQSKRQLLKGSFKEHQNCSISACTKGSVHKYTNTHIHIYSIYMHLYVEERESWAAESTPFPWSTTRISCKVFAASEVTAWQLSRASCSALKKRGPAAAGRHAARSERGGGILRFSTHKLPAKGLWARDKVLSYFCTLRLLSPTTFITTQM